MKDDDLPQRPRSLAHRDALRMLGNPYASLQTYPVPEIRARTKEESAYIRELGDQYASLSIAISGTETSAPARPPVAQVPATASKAEFSKQCRRIFGQYIPAVEKGRLRRHQIGFITRNIDRAPGIRGVLLAELRKFDLGDRPGFRARFNRERNPFTEAKLRDIELKVNRRKT